ncbi:MAG: hypothetical protein Q9211_006589 [Gyalolechia sp. 1 TL-2023]
MGKRERDEFENAVPHKRLRSDVRDRFSALSDELLLVLLSYLPIYDLTRCEQLSHRLKVIASDSQLWKSAYYDRFVRPRAVRIPGVREAGSLNKSLLYSSKISKWLEDGHLVRLGGSTNWKRQYKLRHNWSRGRCKRTETEIAERPSIPPVLVRLHEGIIVTADSTAGLRAWSMHGEERLIASMAWATSGHPSAVPSSLAIDISRENSSDLPLSVGFLDGSFGVFVLDRRKRTLTSRYMHASSVNGVVTAIALSFPYLLTMTEAQLLSLYAFPTSADEATDRAIHEPPKLLSSLKSYTAGPPLSLSIRCCATSISASIAYAMPTYLEGWSVGLQELRLTNVGTFLESRLATPLNQGFVPLARSQHHSRPSSSRPDASFAVVSSRRMASSSARPTSLSYNHPYLLAAHSDNTMTLYLVTSNAQQLSISPGTRLCGHTSSVSGAHVGDRGKAVSVSARGDDLRVWELEGGITSSKSKRREGWGDTSVAIIPNGRDSPVLSQDTRHGNVSKGMAQGDIEESIISKGWLSFDEEQVVLLGEKGQGTQALIVYNFA